MRRRTGKPSRRFGLSPCSSLCYVLRPMRDAIVIEAGDQNLRWMFTATFAAMLTAIPVFGFLTGRWRRERVLTILSLGFSTAFLVFFFLFANQVKPLLVAGTFFVWISVFNFCLTSAFWSFMADIFTNEQARRLYGGVCCRGERGSDSRASSLGGAGQDNRGRRAFTPLKRNAGERRLEEDHPLQICLARPCTQHRARCPRNAGTRLPARRCHHGKRGPSILRQSRAKGSLFICTAASSHTKRREIDMWRRQ